MTKSLNDPSIKLVNHASVVIREGRVAILSDPWYFGTAFNDGWSLLYQNPEEDIIDVLNSISHIWISHEHPDHFSVPFFIRYADIINKNQIEILFQETKDQRVVNFLRSKKINVRELVDKKRYDLSNNMSIRCIKSFFYDSALEVQIGEKKILNLNDCPISKPAEIEFFSKEFGSYDILLTQFSYAAWKGGKDNIQWRKRAAEEKIETMKHQSKILGARYLIPFASFIRFSNHMNFYLNDQVNRPADVSNILRDDEFDVIFLKPMVEQNIDDLKPSDEAINFWEEKFSLIKDARLSEYEPVHSENDLNESFKLYKARVFENNNKIIIYLINLLPLGLFKSVRFKLSDLQRCVDVDITAENLIFTDLKEDFDIELESASLDFLFKNTFGFDTLTVNGCFEQGKKGGFSRLTKSLAIENLNNLGISLNMKLIFKLDLVFLFLKSLRRVSAKLVV